MQNMMRQNILFVLLGLMAGLFAGCNTDDLERDIDALAERVASVEDQVELLNDNMNIVRVMLDGNKTITEWSQDGDTYLLTLSNGETYRLTPGAIGGNYPSVEISPETGNWVIGGMDTGQRAVAENGDNATVTPEFKIEGGRWWVRYGGDWEELGGGSPAGTNADANPIMEAYPSGDNFVIVMNGETYNIPVVKDLVCAIDKESLGLADEDVWTLKGGEEAVFRVNVGSALPDEALLRVKVPAEWKAAPKEDADGMKTFAVTPPEGASECVIVVERTEGVYTVTDELKAKVASESYYDDYLAGFDVTVGDVTINRYDNPGAVLVEDGGTISAEGIYFIAEGATATLTKAGGVTLIGEKKGVASRAQTTKRNLAIDGDFLCKGIELTSTDNGANILSLGGSASVGKVYFENCRVILPDGMNFAYFSGGVGIDYLMIRSCYFSLPPADSRNFLNLQKKAYGTIEFRNNVVYCNAADRYACFNILMGSPSIDVLKVENNTFINQAVWEGKLANFDCASEAWTIKDNLFWYNSEKEPSGAASNALLNTVGTDVPFDAANFEGNRVCTSLASTVYAWKVLFSNPPASFTGNVLPLELNTTPFEEGSVPHEGKYTLKPEYEGVGAVIE